MVECLRSGTAPPTALASPHASPAAQCAGARLEISSSPGIACCSQVCSFHDDAYPAPLQSLPPPTMPLLLLRPSHVGIDAPHAAGRCPGPARWPARFIALYGRTPGRAVRWRQGCAGEYRGGMRLVQLEAPCPPPALRADCAGLPDRGAAPDGTGPVASGCAVASSVAGSERGGVREAPPGMVWREDRLPPRVRSGHVPKGE